MKTVQQKIDELHREGGKIICICGESGSGKSTLAKCIEMCNKDVVILDGDVVRRFVSDDLSYSLTDRRLNNERVSRIAMMLAFMGKTVIISTVRADFSYENIKNSGFDGFLQLIKVERLRNGTEKDS